jgi:hypothetical protein
MAPQRKPREIEATPEQESLLEQLARREHEEREAESRLFERYGKRAEIAKQLWAAIIGLIVFVVAATAYVLNMKADVTQLRADHERLAREVERNRTDIQENRKTNEQLRLDLKDKADRK